MARVDNVYTSLSVDVDVKCDCGESINLDGTYVDETCECGIMYSTRISHNGSEYTVIVKQNGEEIHEDNVCFR